MYLAPPPYQLLETSNRTLPQNSRTPRPTNLVERGGQKEQPEGNCGWGDARPTTTLGESMDHTCSKHGRATVIEAVRSQVASAEGGPNDETSETGQGWTTVSRSARQATQRKEISQRANRTPIRPRLQELRGTMGSMGPAVVCWTDIQESRGTFWKRVQRSCNNGRLMDHLVKITRTEQKPRLARFTIYTHTGYGVALLQHMRRLQHKWGWYVREHRADRTFDTRVKRVQGKNATDKDGLHDGGENSTGEQISKWCKVGTLNINGALNKKYELQFLLEKSRIDCLALQETGIRETDWNLNVAGYHSFSVCGERRASKRGVSILLKKTMSGYVVGTSSPWHLFIRCFGNGLECPWILGCVYLPSGKAAEEPIKLVTEELAKLRKAFPIDPVAIMGDWNRTVNKVETLVKRVDHDFAVLRSAGLKATRAASNRAIDHIAVRMGKAGKSRSTQVLTSIDISDHYPVVCKILSKREKRGSGAPRAGRGEPGPSSGGDMSNGGRQGRRIATSQIPIPGTRDYEQKGARGRESHNRVVNSNYWQPLVDLASTDITNMDADECQHFGDVAADTLTRIIHKVAADTEMSVGTKPPKSRRLKKRIANAINARGRLHERAKRSTVGSEENRKAWEQHSAKAEQVRKMVRDDRRREWRRALKRVCGQLRHNPREFWQWTSRVAGWRKRNSMAGVQPVQHPDSGQLLTEATTIRDAWKTHYGRLAADITGNSQTGTKWTRWQAAPKRRPLTYLDKTFTWGEVSGALKRLKRHKAPGSDGIPADMYKLAIGEEQSPMGEALLAVINLMWKGRVIPAVWQESTVISIPKKGDLTDMNNYRGISLMGTGLKILMVLISVRLNDAFEREKLFSKAQAGFRRLEECVTQSACLMEIAKRRMVKGQGTYLAFVDLKKAYDTVPHEALMSKLDFYGVRGRMLEFIRELYKKSRITVRCGGKCADPVDLNRGVRQGCPLSPVLFNIFINDILDGTESLGVPVGATAHERVSGLLFADDLVGLTSSRRKLVQQLNHLTQWMKDNEMAAGIHKCGVMVTGRKTSRLSKEPERWVLSGQRIPIVDSYKYLGLNFHKNLNVEEMMGDRVAAGKKLTGTITPFLKCASIPLPMKVAVVRTVMVPRLLFGAEVYGMNKKITQQMQVFLNRTSRMMLGISANATVSNTALWREIGIPPICAQATARRARALQKARKLSTWVSTLVETPFKSRYWTWVTGTNRWMKRYGQSLTGWLKEKPKEMAMDNGQGWKRLPPKSLCRVMVEAVWRREERVTRSRSGDRYLNANFDLNPLTTAQAGGYPMLTRGLGLIVKCRVGGFWPASRLAKRGLIHTQYLTVCPCCKRQDPETLQHVLLDCPRWEVGRRQLMTELLGMAAEIVGTGTARRAREHVVTLLLGGEYKGKTLDSWALNASYETPQTSSEGTGNDCTYEDDGDQVTDLMENPGVRKFGCLRVAGFMAWMVRVRTPIILALRQESQVPFSTTDRSPNG